MKELLELKNTVDELEKLGEGVKLKKKQLSDALLLNNKLNKLELTKEDRDQLKLIQAKLKSLRNLFTNKDATGVTKDVSPLIKQPFEPSRIKEHKEIARALLTKSDQETLHYFIQLGKNSPNTIIDYNFIDAAHNTALCLAAANNKPHTLEFLLSNGADPNFPGDDNACAVLYAATNGFKNIVEILVKYGADINKQDNHGNTAFTSSMDRGHVDLAHYILDKTQVNILSKDTSGLTPLHYAVQIKSYSLVEKLLKLGLNPDQPANVGLTPIDLASQIISNIAKINPPAPLNHTAEVNKIYKLLLSKSSHTTFLGNDSKDNPSNIKGMIHTR